MYRILPSCFRAALIVTTMASASMVEAMPHKVTPRFVPRSHSELAQQNGAKARREAYLEIFDMKPGHKSHVMKAEEGGVHVSPVGRLYVAAEITLNVEPKPSNTSSPMPDEDTTVVPVPATLKDDTIDHNLVTLEVYLQHIYLRDDLGRINESLGSWHVGPETFLKQYRLKWLMETPIKVTCMERDILAFDLTGLDKKKPTTEEKELIRLAVACVVSPWEAVFLKKDDSLLALDSTHEVELSQFWLMCDVKCSGTLKQAPSYQDLDLSELSDSAKLARLYEWPPILRKSQAYYQTKLTLNRKQGAVEPFLDSAHYLDGCNHQLFDNTIQISWNIRKLLDIEFVEAFGMEAKDRAPNSPLHVKFVPERAAFRLLVKTTAA